MLAQVCPCHKRHHTKDDDDGRLRPGRGRRRGAMPYRAAARAGPAVVVTVIGAFLQWTVFVRIGLDRDFATGLLDRVPVDPADTGSGFLVTGGDIRALSLLHEPGYGKRAPSAHVPLRSPERALRAPRGHVDMPLQAWLSSDSRRVQHRSSGQRRHACYRLPKPRWMLVRIVAVIASGFSPNAGSLPGASPKPRWM